MFVSIDMVNVVLDLKCIILKYVLETINYNKVYPVIKWAQIFIKLRIPKSLIWRTYFIKYQQLIVK